MVIEVQINRGRLVRRGQWLTPIIEGEGGRPWAAAPAARRGPYAVSELSGRESGRQPLL